VSGKRPTVVVAHAPYQAEVEPAQKHALSRQFDATRRLNFLNQNKIGHWIILPALLFEELRVFRIRCRITICVRSHGVYSSYKLPLPKTEVGLAKTLPETAMLRKNRQEVWPT
jgi:hypothetical protein